MANGRRLEDDNDNLVPSTQIASDSPTLPADTVPAFVVEIDPALSSPSSDPFAHQGMVQGNGEAKGSASERYSNLDIDEKKEEEKASSEDIEAAMEEYKLLIDSKSYAMLAEALNTPRTTKQCWETLPEAKQEELLNYYIKKNRSAYNSVMSAAYAGYVAEFFYIYWDLQARLTIIPKLLNLSKNTTSTDLLETLFWLNISLVTPGIVIENITYKPSKEARDYMKDKMLDPNTSAYNVIKHNKILFLLFMLYAFEGSFIDVVALQDPVRALGGVGLLTVFNFLLITGGMGYYVLFQAKDAINDFPEWVKEPWLLQLAFRALKNKDFDSVKLYSYIAIVETLAAIERMMRLGYGSFAAGYQMTNDQIAAFLSLGVGGLSALPTALATRCYTFLKMFSPRLSKVDKPSHVKNEIAQKTLTWFELAENDLQTQYSPFRREATLLFLTPNIFPMAAASYIAYQLGSLTSSDPATQIGVGSTFALATSAALHQWFRVPALRKWIIEKALELRLKNSTGATRSNLLCKILTTYGSVCGQFSRITSFGFILATMLPSFFDPEYNLETGLRNLMMLELFESFISVPQYHYQWYKIEGALKAFFPKLLTVNNAAQPTLDRAAASVPQDTGLVARATSYLPSLSIFRSNRANNTNTGAVSQNIVVANGNGAAASSSSIPSSSPSSSVSRNKLRACLNNLYVFCCRKGPRTIKKGFESAASSTPIIPVTASSHSMA